MCDVEKDVIEFYKASKLPSGFQSRCKLCTKISYNGYRHKRLSHYKKVKEDRRIQKTLRVIQLKETQGCQCCNETFGPCLQFHHLDPNMKSYNIADMVARDASWNRLIVEVKKCIVVCGNCHVKIHNGVIQI